MFFERTSYDNESDAKFIDYLWWFTILIWFFIILCALIAEVHVITTITKTRKNLLDCISRNLTIFLLHLSMFYINFTDKKNKFTHVQCGRKFSGDYSIYFIDWQYMVRIISIVLKTNDKSRENLPKQGTWETL